MKKRITKILAGAMALCLMVGTFAFFTDRETQKTAGKAGSIDLTWEDISAKAGSNNEFAQDKVWDDESTKTFTFVTEDTVLRENLVACADTSNLLINTLLDSLS